jgi:hypothetical protein
MIVGIIIILLTVGLSQCNESNSNKINTNKEKILGTWLVNGTSKKQTRVEKEHILSFLMELFSRNLLKRYGEYLRLQIKN